MNQEVGSNEKTWVRITPCRNIPLREGRAVEAGGRRIAIFNLGDRFLAVENQCPHKSGPLADGIVSGAMVVCPLHAWKFSLESGLGVAGPSSLSCVETFPVRVEHGIICVGLPLEPSAREMPPFCMGDNESGQLNCVPRTATGITQ